MLVSGPNASEHTLPILRHILSPSALAASCPGRDGFASSNSSPTRMPLACELVLATLDSQCCVRVLVEF
jgi:hypothetical protein